MSDDPQQIFSLRLSGDGINIEQQIERRTALQIVQVVMGGGTLAIGQEATSPVLVARPSDTVSLSLREHLDEVRPSKKPEQIVTIAHYVCEIERQADFSRDDIRSRFITAREPAPGNFGRDFAIAVKNGWVAEVHGKKNRYYVTAKGVQAIGNNFSNGKGAPARR
ncbi:MAG: hypothetical protein RLO48_21520 [Bauldia litoralis]